MSRRHLLLACAGETIAATLDLPMGAARVGLLIVGGGNEPRAGPAASYARLAGRIAREGFAVLRFDRRGLGDSSGINRGFRDQTDEIATALTALRAAGPRQVLAFGNCDAASALMLGAGHGADALALANPWVLAESGEASGAALRAHYRRRLASGATLKRLVRGDVSWRGLVGGLKIAAAPSPANPLAEAMAAGLARFAGPVRILLADGDRTADAFLGHWDRTDPRLRHCAGADHGFLAPDAADWMFSQLAELLRAFG